MAQQSTQPHPYTRDIATFVSGLTYDKIPEEVRHRNKLLMLDSLGCALYGADLEWTRILQDKLSSIDSTRQCTVWGTNKKLSAPHAALVNGTAAHALDYDNGSNSMGGHASATMVPALLAAMAGTGSAGSAAAGAAGAAGVGGVHRVLGEDHRVVVGEGHAAAASAHSREQRCRAERSS